MLQAGPDSVVGDFGGTRFTYAGVTSTFHETDHRYWVRTDGPEGALHDYPVAYTFGIHPLQQYLIEFPKGRMQALSICWDSRPRAEGGQRWFHLHPGEKVDFRDVLHWTGVSQNWNFMCAECHSTNLRKNYRVDGDRYETGWSEVNVSCEACHGPGSNHADWASAVKAGRPDTDPAKGLEIRLGDVEGGGWILDPGAPTAHRAALRDTRPQLDTCGRCHARRAQIAEDTHLGRPIGDAFRVALLEEGLYHADGQIQDEVYEYGSFLQSRMYRKGVTCTDCHGPHAVLRFDDLNAVCARCHRPEVFDTTQHHFHKQGGRGAICVECHMATRNYMVVDARRDHSFRIPRPDLSVALGTPNTCNDCHRDRPPQWAADAIARWRGGAPKRPFHWGEAIHAGRTWQVGAGDLLARVAGDPEMPAIARATAVTLVTRFPGPGTVSVLEQAARHADPLLRRAAADAAQDLDEADRVRISGSLLADPERAVRLEAVGALIGVTPSAVKAERRAALDAAIAEYRETQAFNADRAESWVNLGTLEAWQGIAAQAEKDDRVALALEPMFVPGAINLADLCREQGREAEAEKVLREALARVPGSAEAHHSLGLALARQHHIADAITELARAASLAPANPRFVYVYGVALHDGGDPKRAAKILAAAARRFPAYTPITQALLAFGPATAAPAPGSAASGARAPGAGAPD
jgi:tetratricopeptide (TPR) repeat protein